MTAKEWLALNDPKYVKPAVKAARTRQQPFDPQALAALLGGTGLRKVGGRYTQCLSVAFEGGNENEAGQVVPVVEAQQEANIDSARFEATHIHKSSGSRKGRSKRRRANRRD